MEEFGYITFNAIVAIWLQTWDDHEGKDHAHQTMIWTPSNEIKRLTLKRLVLRLIFDLKHVLLIRH